MYLVAIWAALVAVSAAPAPNPAPNPEPAANPEPNPAADDRPEIIEIIAPAASAQVSYFYYYPIFLSIFPLNSRQS